MEYDGSVTELTSFPRRLFNLSADMICEVLNGPALIHLEGVKKQPVFVAALLHGNEDVGFEAIKKVLSRYSNSKRLPRSVMIFIGNVTAAKQKSRLLPGQRDFNRIWSGANGPEGVMAKKVLDIALGNNVIASIDVHNNTGLNPHYAVVTDLSEKHLSLAAHFERRVLHFTSPKTTLTAVMSKHCPSVTIECGLPGGEGGADHAADFIDSVLNMESIPPPTPPEQSVELYQTVAIVKPTPGANFGFGDNGYDLSFPHSVEKLNFHELWPGSVFARLSRNNDRLLVAYDTHGADISDDFFELDNKRVVLRRRVTPSMLTKDIDVIKSDCLCYFMNRIGYTALSD